MCKRIVWVSVAKAMRVSIYQDFYFQFPAKVVAFIVKDWRRIFDQPPATPWPWGGSANREIDQDSDWRYGVFRISAKR